MKRQRRELRNGQRGHGNRCGSPTGDFLGKDEERRRQVKVEWGRLSDFSFRKNGAKPGPDHPTLEKSATVSTPTDFQI